METLPEKSTDFSLIEKFQPEVSKYAYGSDQFEMELKDNNDHLCLVSTNKCQGLLPRLTKELYYIESGDIIPMNNCLIFSKRKLDNEIILYVEVPGFAKENIICYLYLSEENMCRTHILVKATKEKDFRMCIAKIPNDYRIQPIGDSVEFLSKPRNKLEYGILELHFDKA